MKNTSMQYGEWNEAEPDVDAPVHRRRRLLSSRERVLLAIAAALFAFSLGLEDGVVNWVLRSRTASADSESQHLDDVKNLLKLEQARRAAQANQQR